MNFADESSVHNLLIAVLDLFAYLLASLAVGLLGWWLKNLSSEIADFSFAPVFFLFLCFLGSYVPVYLYFGNRAKCGLPILVLTSSIAAGIYGCGSIVVIAVLHGASELRLIASGQFLWIVGTIFLISLAIAMPVRLGATAAGFLWARIVYRSRLP